MALLSLLDRVNDLKRLPRTGWLLMGISPAESIADHAFATALIALLLAEAINADLAAISQAESAAPLDVGRVLQIALLHDLAESMVTDLPHRATALFGSAAKHDAERAAMAAVTQELPNGPAWQTLWAEYAANDSPEARLVRDADKIELAHQALRYTQSGYSGLDEFLAPRALHFAQSEALFAEICTAFSTQAG